MFHLFCRTCRELRHLPPPRSLALYHKMGRWTERRILDYRMYQLHVMATRELSSPTSQPTPTPDSSRATEREMDNIPKRESTR